MGRNRRLGSVSVLNLQSLVHLTGGRDVRSRLDQALGRLGPRLGQAARVVPMMAAALSQLSCRDIPDRRGGSMRGCRHARLAPCAWQRTICRSPFASMSSPVHGSARSPNSSRSSGR